MKNKSLNLIMGLMMLVALTGAIMLVKENQNTERGAYFAGTKIFLQPESVNKAVGEQLIADLYVETDASAKISSIDTEVCYGNQLSLGDNPKSRVIINTQALDTLMDAAIVSTEGNKCLRIIAIANPSAKPEDLKSGVVKIATIKFDSISAGSDSLRITRNLTKVGGYNPDVSATDSSLSVTVTGGTVYTIGGGGISPTPIITDGTPILNYQVSFGHIKAGDAKCVVDWPMQVIVLANGESKSYSDVKASSVTESDGKVIFKGSLPLVGFSYSNNIAAFIKGPKHLQMKYAVQNQSAPYDRAGGELEATASAANSTLYNFSAYPMVPGDVIGANSDTPDGWIDGVDFSYVKSRSLTHETVAEGGYIKSDLDGNCQVNSNDVNVLKISLQTKQGQLY